MAAETRRSTAAFLFSRDNGLRLERGEGQAEIGDEGLTVGEVSVSFLDADALRVGDYQLEIELWPGGRLVLSQLGRRFETFAHELRRVRNQARVAGLLAHGITMPDVFNGAVLSNERFQSAEVQVFDTHLTIVPEDEDPWQLPLGAITDVAVEDDPPQVVIATQRGLTRIGRLGRQRDALYGGVLERRTAQRTFLEELTGRTVFADGWGVPRRDIEGCEELVSRFSSTERASGAEILQSMATGDVRFGFVQLLDPDAEGMSAPTALPAHWAAFLLVPVGALIVLEILAGPSAATYVFQGDIDSINRNLQLLHFRRAPLALTAEQALLTPENPHRLALRRLEPLQQLRAATTARIIHSENWENALRTVVAVPENQVSTIATR